MATKQRIRDRDGNTTSPKVPTATPAQPEVEEDDRCPRRDGHPPHQAGKTAAHGASVAADRAVANRSSTTGTAIAAPRAVAISSAHQSRAGGSPDVPTGP